MISYEVEADRACKSRPYLPCDVWPQGGPFFAGGELRSLSGRAAGSSIDQGHRTECSDIAGRILRLL